MATWYIRVLQTAFELHDPDDRVDLPAGDGGEGSFHDYDIEADSEDEALDRFHETIPIGCLDDFEIFPVTEQECQSGGNPL